MNNEHLYSARVAAKNREKYKQTNTVQLQNTVSVIGKIHCSNYCIE